jgi:hypothetical protein
MSAKIVRQASYCNLIDSLKWLFGSELRGWKIWILSVLAKANFIKMLGG